VEARVENKQLTRRKRKKRRGLFDPKVWLIIVLAGVFFYFWNENNKKEVAEKAEILPPVIVVQPVQGDLERVFTANGFVESESLVTVLPRVSGLLMELSAEVGQSVRAGEVLARIDSEHLSLTLKQAEAAYLSAKSSYDRMEQLFQAKATSRQNYDQAKSQYEAYKAQYDLALLQFEYATITSPLDGVILVKHQTAGSLVSPQVPLVTVGDLSRLVIKAKVPEKYYDLYYENQETMEIRITRPDSPGKTIKGHIRSISPIVSAQTKSFDVICDISGDIESLRPGMFIHTSFVLNRLSDTLSLPFGTLLSGKELWYVDGENSTARRLEYSPDYFSNDRFAVPENFADMEFILEGQHFIREGQKVKIIEDQGFEI